MLEIATLVDMRHSDPHLRQQPPQRVDWKRAILLLGDAAGCVLWT